MAVHIYREPNKHKSLRLQIKRNDNIVRVVTRPSLRVTGPLTVALVLTGRYLLVGDLYDSWLFHSRILSLTRQVQTDRSLLQSLISPCWLCGVSLYLWSTFSWLEYL